ncbi:secretory carrier-associated membrane protein 2 [Sinocyclocheilus grahami]|uniref:Secretory carrier-associated membrane protein n=1 Tax=Sinocyclocheilus grahami TaxID=75366 RepID=A0A672N4F9_SINGR|nr:PREDICTED: secretory carrier-associated membrane protein 2 [Sinocyclocheilus grahami]
MSGFDSNPFEDSVDVNPFQDPSVTQVTNSGIDHIESFNPFPDGNSVTAAVLQPSVEPRPKAVAAAAQGNLLKQQEELERKAAKLERREQEVQSRGALTGKPNNWPPLPKFFPIKPCFYQDFSEEIPQENRRLCKMIYYLWMWQCVTLFLNIPACLAEFTTSTDAGVDFGLSILWFILFAPCSFLCWFRPVYNAFRSDSSFNFFVFFFVFLAQIVVSVIQSVGIPRWGNSGWISAIAVIGKNKVVGVIMMVVAAFFMATAALSVILLKMVHAHYRRTGANFQKAQQEFSQGVVTNHTFQTAAATAATTAAQSSLQRN